MSTPIQAPAKAEDEGYAVDPDSTRTAPQDDPTEASSLTSSTASPPLSPPPTNANLAPLRALFPSTSDDILEAVLEAHSGDLQAATESLLDLNNPEFKSDPAQQEEMEQIDLDAELARQLAEEDQLQYQRQERDRSSRPQPREQQQQQQQPVPVTYQAYVPKNRRRPVAAAESAQEGHGSWQPPSAAAASSSRPRQQTPMEDERDELDVLAENFSKLAEQGKKSFGSFMSKMKEQVGKLDEMIQQSASPSTAPDRPPQPPPKPTPSNYGSPRMGAQWTAPEPLPRPTDAPPRTSSLIAPRDTLHRQDTNDSFTIGDDTDHSPNPSPNATRQPNPPGESIDSYFKDFDSRGPPEPPIKVNRNDTPSSPTEPEPATSTASAAAETKPVEVVETTNASQAPAPKNPRPDFSKIGLLPRRSVSLLDDDKLHRPSSTEKERIKSPLAHPAEKKVQHEEEKRGNESDEDSDELEYVKNPFDEE
ncbi:uncharacterized protein JCM6883_002828 [Sporobolomyces salmoneus]|uniref:uncharacterized protein n=1 Tax=Sporobolomyces salmoneus TaxID=183962 RepID=UPI00316D1E17